MEVNSTMKDWVLIRFKERNSTIEDKLLVGFESAVEDINT